MNYAKYFSIFVFSATLIYGGVGFYLLPQATFQGDLTRVGLLPESEFGWRLAQPKLDTLLFTQSSMQDADVLVIGDSFSVSLVWQTALTKQHLKVHTEHWSNLGGVCSGFMPWLHKQGFKGKYIILESIERGLMSNLDNSISCEQVQYHSNNIKINDGLGGPPGISFDIHAGNYAGKLSTGIQTQFNLIKYKTLNLNDNLKTMSLANDIQLSRVTNGCELFSHNDCSDALFLGEDKAAEIENNTLEKIEQLNSRLIGITPIWAIVPNKSTAYLYPNKQFWNKIEQRIHAPNLLRMTQEAITQKVVDLYPANNTHFSTRGYLLMGEMIYKSMIGSQ